MRSKIKYMMDYLTMGFFCIYMCFILLIMDNDAEDSGSDFKLVKTFKWVVSCIIKQSDKANLHKLSDFAIPLEITNAGNIVFWHELKQFFLCIQPYFSYNDHIQISIRKRTQVISWVRCVYGNVCVRYRSNSQYILKMIFYNKHIMI